MYLVNSFLISILFWTGSPITNNNPVGEFWQTDYEQALSQAKKEKKTIMLYFSGSDWCKPCIIWKKEVFDTDTFHSYATKNLVPVKLDFPRLKKNRLPENQVEQNESLAKKYNNEGVFPLVVFINASGKVIEKSSYRSGGPDEYIKYVETVLAKNYK